MDGESNGHDATQNGKPIKRPTKIRDIFTDRIVGIVGGACIPLVLLLIPVINKYLDNDKEIQKLKIETNAKDIEQTNQRLSILTQALASSQIQGAGLTVDLKRVTDALDDCKKKGHK